MTKFYVRSLKEYDDPVELDAEKILAAMQKFKDAPKKPTSIALDAKTIQRLKVLSEKRGIPYQVLMRVLILEGLDRFQAEELKAS